MDNSRPSWAEIDLQAIKHNLGSIRRAAGKAQVMAVVKANAYGHGVREVSRVCQDEGVDFFGVATLEEALELRRAGSSLPILVLGYIAEEYAATAIEADIRPCIFNMEAARAYSRAATALSRTAYVHVKLDTGMGRIGFYPDRRTEETIAEMAVWPGIKVEGIFTHLAVADTGDEEYTRQQLECFDSFIRSIEQRGISIPIRHCANSAALMKYPDAAYNMVRAGIVLYGLTPSPEMDPALLDIIPAMTLKSRITFLKTLPAGYTVSYGRTYRCQRDTRVATIPIGYADGYSRLLSNRARAVVRGQLVPLIGTVCMDQCMFDVSGVEDVAVGDEVVLFGRPEAGVTADDLAEIMGTINYEVVCAISPRVPRVYSGKKA